MTDPAHLFGRLSSSHGAVTHVLTVMRGEAAAIERAAAAIDREGIDKALSLILACDGKIVISGVGKSGHVARKMAASFNSVGAPAVFLDAADAGHGDLGVVRHGDVVILVSHSGQSEELLALLPHIERRGVPLVAIVGSRRSSLAQAATAVIVASVESEACPLNLAPLASSAVAQAICDGLVSAIMQSRGLTAEDFARNHPAGRIGKRLTLRSRDLMHGGDDNPVVRPETAWHAVLATMCKHALGGVNVVDSQGGLVGIITDGDIRRAVQRRSAAEFTNLTAADAMTRTPVTVADDCLIVDALEVMENRKSQISVVPVVQGAAQKCVGLLRLHDIVRSGVL